jgi:ADP-heptose:LPS heptosyltransferase
MYDMIVPSGIGDFSWIYSKFYNLGKEINLSISDGNPRRLGPYTELLSLVKNVNYDGPPYELIRKLSIRNVKELQEEHPFCIEVNRHLESGYKLKDWLPELETNYHYPININSVLKLPFNYVVVYASSRGSVKKWNGWAAPEWAEFISYLKSFYGNYAIVLVGAEYDATLSHDITNRCRNANIHNYVGKLGISDTLKLIKDCKYMIAFPSGLPILANVMNVPVTMMYANEIKGIMGTFADPISIQNGTFNEILFPRPHELITWLNDVYRIKDKL